MAVAVMPGAPLLEVAVPDWEVFGIPRLELADPWYELQNVRHATRGVIVAGGFESTAPFTLADLVGADTVIVPACSDIHEEQPADLVEAVREAHARGARVVALCSGAFVLAQAGLLDGKRATTHWMHADALLRRRFPSVVVDERVLNTSENRVHTSAGTAAAIDLCIELVRQDHGASVANALARRMVTPPHREADQAQYVQAPLPEATTAPLGPVIDWALSHLHEPVRLRDLAAKARLSERQFTRRFIQAHGQSPGEWLTRDNGYDERRSSLSAPI